MPLKVFDSKIPQIGNKVFLAPDAWVIGQVVIDSDVSVFFGAVLRGDIQKIFIGQGTNIQEHALVHTSHDLPDAIIGCGVTIGHRAIIHGCSVGDNCIIGMGSTILDAAKIGSNCIIGANSLITKGTVIPDGSLVMGSPAKVIRPLNDAEKQSIVESAKHYQDLRLKYLKLFEA